MNKKSQFTKIFSQALLDMKDNGRLEIFQARNKQSCITPDPTKKSLGFKKLAFLFVVLVSGIFISIFVVFFEFMAKLYSEKQKSTTFGTTTINDYEINPENDHIEGFLENLSVEETKKVLQRILERHMKTSDIQDLTQGKSRIPIPVKKKEIHGQSIVTSDDIF